MTELNDLERFVLRSLSRVKQSCNDYLVIGQQTKQNEVTLCLVNIVKAELGSNIVKKIVIAPCGQIPRTKMSQRKFKKRNQPQFFAQGSLKG